MTAELWLRDGDGDDGQDELHAMQHLVLRREAGMKSGLVLT